MNLLNYFFQRSPEQPQLKFFLIIILISIGLILGSIIFSTIYKKKRKKDFALKRLFKHTSKTMLILGILLGFFVLVRYERIPYFAMRIWTYLTLALISYFTYKYIKTYKTTYQIDKQNNPSNKNKSGKIKPKYTTKKKKR